MTILHLGVDFMGDLAYSIIMNNQINPLQRFQVVAVHRVTGSPQFAKVDAPSQSDADDFVADMQPEWIIIRSLPTKKILDI